MAVPSQWRDLDCAISGYVAPFAQPLDVTSYNALILVLRGGFSNEHVKVGIGDSADHEQKVLASQFVAGGMGVEWQAVMVPLRAFTTINRRAVTRVVIAFENLKSNDWWKENNVSLILSPDPLIEDIEILKLKKKSLELAGIF